MAALTAVSVYFSTSASTWWWVHLEALNFIHLPTRFLGAANLGLALLGGKALEAVWQRWSPRAARTGAVLLAGTALAFSGWPWLYVAYCPAPDSPDRLSLAHATTWPRWYAEAQAELLPRWVDELPPEDGLISQYEAGGSVNRLELPPEVALRAWETGPGWDRYELATDAPVSLTYHTFYFPSWQARLDGVAVPHTITAPTGLMALELPSGQHHLEIAFHATPLRRFSFLSSLPFTLAVLGPMVTNPKRRFVVPAAAVSTWPGGVGAAFLLLGLLLPGLRAGVDHMLPILRQCGALSTAGHPLAVDFSGEFTILGYSGPQEIRRDQSLLITQYWAPQREIGVPYGFALYVTDEQGRVWQQTPGRPFSYRDYPGELGWRVGAIARDAYEIALLPGVPPSLYWLEVEGFRRDAAASVIPQDWPTGPNPARARVGQLRVTPGKWTLNAENAYVDMFAPASSCICWMRTAIW